MEIAIICVIDTKGHLEKHQECDDEDNEQLRSNKLGPWRRKDRSNDRQTHRFDRSFQRRGMPRGRQTWGPMAPTILSPDYEERHEEWDRQQHVHVEELEQRGRDQQTREFTAVGKKSSDRCDEQLANVERVERQELEEQMQQQEEEPQKYLEQPERPSGVWPATQ